MISQFRIPAPKISSDTSTIPCRNPATTERLGDVPVMGAAEVQRRVERARAAQIEWGQTSFAERRRVLRTILDHIVTHQEEICRLAARDSGKTMVDAVMGEVFPVAEKIRYLIASGERDLSPQPRSPGIFVHKRAWVEYQPLGVIGVIAPWNFPFHNLMCPVLPALFAGNAVIAKVSEWASWSAADYAAIFHQALEKHGHSAELVQVITGYGETGQHLIRSGVDKIFFTGSGETGRKVAATASESLTPVVLELGGKDPMIVLDDADIDHAIGAAMLGVFTACGQMCVGAERIYVHDAIHDRFVEKVIAKVAELRQGPPLEDAPVDIGSTTMPVQLAKVESLVDDAVDKGARAIVGGARNEDHAGLFFQPTVLVDVTHEMRIAREEAFGPVMTILRFHSDEEALRLANDTTYGLGCSVFSGDIARAERLARGVRSGMGVVNDYGIAYMAQALPFGGVQGSGYGRINGREGLRACCHTKAMLSDRLPIQQGVDVYPVSPSTFAFFEGLIAGIYGRGLLPRAKAATRAVRNLIRLGR